MAVCPNCKQVITRLGMFVDRDKERPYETFYCRNDDCMVEFINVYVKV